FHKVRHHFGPLGGYRFSGFGVANEVQGELMAECGVLGAAAATELAPALSDLIQFMGPDLRCGPHDLCEIVEVPAPIAIIDSQKEIFLGREVLIYRTFGVSGCPGDVIERSR